VSPPVLLTIPSMDPKPNHAGGNAGRGESHFSGA
jgi:hypothetical protein